MKKFLKYVLRPHWKLIIIILILSGFQTYFQLEIIDLFNSLNGLIENVSPIIETIATHQIEKREREEKERRLSYPCDFNNNITKEDFITAVYACQKSIKRIKNITIDGVTVHGLVTSQSGLSEWEFSIDFNDYGKLTGNYWIESDNEDSVIPEVLAKKIVESGLKWNK